MTMSDANKKFILHFCYRAYERSSSGSDKCLHSYKSRNELHAEMQNKYVCNQLNTFIYTHVRTLAKTYKQNC